MASSSGKRPAEAEPGGVSDDLDDKQKPPEAPSVATATLVTEGSTPPPGMVLTYIDAAGKPRYIPQWAIDRPGMDTSKYGVVATATVAKGTASGSTMSPDLPSIYLQLLDVIEDNCGSLADKCCRTSDELQVGAINALIRSQRPDKVELLLDILSTEGINIWAVGSEPPPLLTLANAEAFEGITDVRKVLVDKRADPREMYKGNCAYEVAKARQNPMFY